MSADTRTAVEWYQRSSSAGAPQSGADALTLRAHGERLTISRSLWTGTQSSTEIDFGTDIAVDALRIVVDWVELVYGEEITERRGVHDHVYTEVPERLLHWEVANGPAYVRDVLVPLVAAAKRLNLPVLTRDVGWYVARRVDRHMPAAADVRAWFGLEAGDDPELRRIIADDDAWLSRAG